VGSQVRPGVRQPDPEWGYATSNYFAPDHDLNLTPADAYFGRGQAIPLERERIKRQTIQQRRLLHHFQAA
jgi:hypothetical protein